MSHFSNPSKDSQDLNKSVNSRKQKSFFHPIVQPKLSINQPNDVYEQEADAMADKVMRMPDPEVSNNFFFKPAISSIQRKCAHCEEEEKQMQRKEFNSDVAAPSEETVAYISSLSGGSSLNKKERQFFEPRIGYDFGDVKIHTDADAARSAKSINALAYSNGHNIVFNEGQYSPDTDTGKRLMAHELTHVAQQSSTVNRKIIQRQICTAPSVLLNMSILPGNFGNISSIAGQVAEVFIIRNYCSSGCIPMVTEYFDNPLIASYIAFLSTHNPSLSITQLALISLSAGFQRPDILVDKGPQKEMYEIKPRSPDGILAGMAKLMNLQAFMSVFSLPYITGVIYTPTNPVASVDVIAAGHHLTVTINAYKIAPGLIVYEFCFSEDLVWAILLLALIIALILLAPEIAAGLAAAAKVLGELLPELIPAAPAL